MILNEAKFSCDWFMIRICPIIQMFDFIQHFSPYKYVNSL